MRGRVVSVLVSLLLVGASCGGGPSVPSGSSPPGSPHPSSPAATTSAPSAGEVRLASVGVRLRRVATLDQPLALAVAPGDDALYVAEQGGRIMAIRDGQVDPSPVLDVSARITAGGEQGLLGLAFAPDGAHLYVDFTDHNGDTHVEEYGWAGGRVIAGSRRLVLFVKQPFSNHNGGEVAFGPDGLLYVGLGDGGSGGDPMGNGQSLDTLLGKLLRIDPTPSGDAPYTVPPDNPFVGQASARPEIWAYGLRNPWRFSFDEPSGDLWIGDVGQTAWEEVDVQPADRGGANYGWNAFEGRHPFSGPGVKGTVKPVYEYSHDGGGCAVTGGYVYRGAAIPELRGAYLFGDFCLGRLTAIRVKDGRVVDRAELGPTVENLSSFGRDGSGELFALSLSGGVFRIIPA